MQKQPLYRTVLEKTLDSRIEGSPNFWGQKRKGSADAEVYAAIDIILNFFSNNSNNLLEPSELLVLASVVERIRAQMSYKENTTQTASSKSEPCFCQWLTSATDTSTIS